MVRQKINHLYAAFALAGVVALSGCVSIAPIEPIKNPPTSFRGDNVVEVEFLLPAKVGLRCGQRGTQAFGMPVFHAMACGNGKLITMPDPCDTFTGGAYAAMMCEERSRLEVLPVNVPEWQSLLQPVGYAQDPRPAPTPLKPRAKDTFKVEFVHPSAVYQRCRTRGLELVESESGNLASCGDGVLLTVPNPCMSLEASWYARTLCHEMAHANGWAMDHPGGSFLSDARAGVDPNVVPPPRAVLASLSSDRPLRKASESPAYLAFAAAQAAAGVPGDTFAATLQLAALDKGPVQADNIFTSAMPVTLTGMRTPDLLLAALSFDAGASSPGAARVFAAHTADMPDQPRGLRPRLTFASASTNTRSAPHVHYAALAQGTLHQGALVIQPPAAPARDPKPSPPVWFARLVNETTRDVFAMASAALRSGPAKDEELPAAIPLETAVEALPAPLAPIPPTPRAKPDVNVPARNDKAMTSAAGV